MRLVDADNMDFLKLHLNKSQLKAVLDFMEVQPTAYDMEKVVEQICECDECIGHCVCKEKSMYMDCLKYKKTYEIVVRGGKHD